MPEDHGDNSTSRPVNLPTEIGGYRIQRVLGSGGMATVYAALQKQPRRMVALKVMKAGVNARTALRRFRREVEILGRLRHPFIAQVYDAGVHHEDPTGADEGVPYFVMEYVPAAKTIIEHADSGDLGLHDRLRFFVKVCAAIEHGHQHKIIHRDLKPGNILLTERGEVKIIDFGVARATELDLASQTVNTEAGRLVGTIQYMAPEQVEGTPQDLDPRCDVYALGALLMKLLTGRLPHDFAGLPLHEAARMVREDPPTRPGNVEPDLRGDLETIILKALAKDRRHRYRTAGSLGRDIVRHLSHQPIHARRAGISRRLVLFAQRHRMAIVAAAVVVAIMGLAAVVVTWVSLNARTVERETERELDARQAELQAALKALEAQSAPIDTPSPPPLPEPFSIDAHVGRVTHLAFDPTGRYVASAGADRFVAVWDIESRSEMLRLREHDEAISQLGFCADGSVVASAAGDGTIALVECPTGRLRKRIRHGGGDVTCLALNPDGQVVAFGADDLTIRVRHIDDDDDRIFRSTRGGFHSVAFSHDGLLLAGGGSRDRVTVWETDTGTEVARLEGLIGSIAGVGFNADDSRIYAVTDGGAGMWWALFGDAVSPGQGFPACREPVHSVAFDPSGRRLVSASYQWIGVWDLTTAQRIGTETRSEWIVYSAVVSPDDMLYVTGGSGGELFGRPIGRSD